MVSLLLLSLLVMLKSQGKKPTVRGKKVRVLKMLFIFICWLLPRIPNIICQKRAIAFKNKSVSVILNTKETVGHRCLQMSECSEDIGGVGAGLLPGIYHLLMPKIISFYLGCPFCRYLEHSQKKLLQSSEYLQSP